jgi:hypothetical protein
MAEKEFVLKINGDQVLQSLDDIKKSLDGLGSQFSQAETKSKGVFGKISSGIGQAGKALGSMGKAAGSAFGTIAKFTGVGAILGAASGAFSANQKVVDLWNTATSAASAIVGKLTDNIFKNVEAIGKQNGGFDATKKVIGGLISGGLNILVGVIQGIRLTVLSTQKAWEESVFGSGDVKKIKELSKEIEKTQKDLKETGKAIVDSGKQVVNNFGEAVAEVGQGAEAVIKGVITTAKSLDMGQIVKDADKLTQLNKAAAAADVKRREIQLEYQKSEEKQRQLRDDDSKNLTDRIAANAELLRLQQEQATKEKEQINIKIAAAAQAYKLEKTEENRNKLASARLELADLEERITGQQSEALTNQNSLIKEQKDLVASIGEVKTEEARKDKERTIEKEAEDKRAAAAEITLGKTTAKGLEKAKREQATVLYNIEKERLLKQLALETAYYNQQTTDLDAQIKAAQDAGNTETAAYAELIKKKSDLDQAYKDKTKELNGELVKLNGDRNATIDQQDKDDADRKKARRKEIFDTAVQGATELVNTLQAINDAQMARELKAAGDNLEAQEKVKKDFFEKNKKLAVAQAIISTIQGAVDAFTGMLKVDPSGITGSIFAALALTTGYANVAKIKATQYEGGGTTSKKSTGGTYGSLQTGGILGGPSHDLGGIKTSLGELEGGEFVINRRATANFLPLLNQINASGNMSGPEMSQQQQQQPIIKTYVVASEMSSQQEADAKLQALSML